MKRTPTIVQCTQSCFKLLIQVSIINESSLIDKDILVFLSEKYYHDVGALRLRDCCGVDLFVKLRNDICFTEQMELCSINFNLNKKIKIKNSVVTYSLFTMAPPNSSSCC